MLSPLQKALDEIKFRIPRPILDAVFVNKDLKWKMRPPSLEDQILNSVIRPRVLIDCNLIGGTEIFVDLSNCTVERTDDYTVIYKIPKERTGGRTIISVLNVTFSDPTKLSSYGVAAGIQNTMMMQVGSNVMDAHGSIPMTSTAKAQIIGENVIMVRDTVMLPANIYLRCKIADTDDMSHLQLRSYKHFSNLVTLAVKAFIYNSYIIQMDAGELMGGVQLGKFKEVIDTYADSEELYQTYLTEKWEKVSMMNDLETNQRFLKLLISGGR